MKIYIDAEKIAEEIGQFQESVKTDVKEQVGKLAAQTHREILELAKAQLRRNKDEQGSIYGIFAENCKFVQVSDGIWVVEIRKPALWIEEGVKTEYDMKEALLKKTEPSENGFRYRVIPFDHGKPPSKQTAFAAQVVTDIRNQLRKDKINFKKIERNEDKSPRVGKLHTLDYGGQAPGKGNTPVMQGISIYQTAKGGSVRRDILTFRTVTDAPNQKNKWIHPGFEGKKFIEQAHKWATEIWEKEVLPSIVEKWKK